MPEKKTIERARRDKREGKAPTTQAGEFVREEIEHIREGEHGARSAAQAIAIGLSKARRAGVKLPPPEKGEASEKTRRGAQRALEAGEKKPNAKPSPKRSRATTTALRREGQSAVSEKALSHQAKAAAGERTVSERSAAARKAVRTKGPAERSEAAQKAARTRARHKAGH
ncbi:transcription elongation factor [Variovorax paradoxus]|nr:transcription elongation factor [Variovorax paradoxus]